MWLAKIRSAKDSPKDSSTLSVITTSSTSLIWRLLPHEIGRFWPFSDRLRPVDKWSLTNPTFVITVLKLILDIVVASPANHNI